MAEAEVLEPATMRRPASETSSSCVKPRPVYGSRAESRAEKISRVLNGV